MLKQPFMLIIFGPTAVGKSDVALSIAQQLPAEIVNMDVGQFYKPLTIGTAKPDWRSSPVPHHLFDILNEPKDFTVIDYRALVLSTVQEIWQRGNLPILVGGSGFYLKSLFFIPQAGVTENDSSYEHLSDESLWEQLNRIDPIRAATIHPHDTYRLKRALAIWYATGKKPSECKPAFSPPAPFLLQFLTRERQDLYMRIDARVVQMIDQGWLDEVRSLQGTTWEPFLQKKKLLGYDDLLTYIAGIQTNDRLKATIATIQRKTRNYAKRQLTFWNSLERELVQELNQQDLSKQGSCEVVNLTLTDVDLYIKQLLKRLTVLFTHGEAQ